MTNEELLADYRKLALEVLQRAREAEQCAKDATKAGDMSHVAWRARAWAFHEVYADMRGLELDKPKLPEWVNRLHRSGW